MVNLENRHISVAHGAGRVAVAIADEKIGVDIEALERDFAKVSSRYMSAEEEQQIGRASCRERVLEYV